MVKRGHHEHHVHHHFPTYLTVLIFLVGLMVIIAGLKYILQDVETVGEAASRGRAARCRTNSDCSGTRFYCNRGLCMRFRCSPPTVNCPAGSLCSGGYCKR